MTIVALVTGSLLRPPETKTSKAGKPYTSATIKAGDQFVRLAAFADDVQAALAGLGQGDALSVTGPLVAEIFTPQGKPARVSLSIVADKVLTLKPRQRQDAHKEPTYGGRSQLDDSNQFLPPV